MWHRGRARGRPTRSNAASAGRGEEAAKVGSLLRAAPMADVEALRGGSSLDP